MCQPRPQTQESVIGCNEEGDRGGRYRGVCPNYEVYFQSVVFSMDSGLFYISSHQKWVRIESGIDRPKIVYKQYTYSLDESLVKKLEK